MISYNEFFRNFSNLRDEVNRVAVENRRDPADIQILPVTKTHPKDAIEYAERAGLQSVGENRVQEAAEKSAELPDSSVTWELIGHLQSNKAAQAVATFGRIQSVDSVKLARRLDRFAGEADLILPCLIQVNTGEDPRKFGFAAEGLEKEFEEMLTFENLSIDGFMTVAPLEGGNEVARKAFARLRELAESLRQSFGKELPELSMGMSGDMAEAIAEGATLIRVGSALFGSRT